MAHLQPGPDAGSCAQRDCGLWPPRLYAAANWNAGGLAHGDGGSRPWLDKLTPADLAGNITLHGWRTTTVGSLLLRVIYHYWYHIGEIMSIRQQLGQPNLPDFVGDIDDLAPYRPE